MNNKIMVRFKDDDDIYEEKLDVLMTGMCKSFFSLSIVHRKDTLVGYYNVSKFKSLSKCSELTARTTLLIVEKIIDAIQDCQQYLFFPEEYIINTNTIYIDSRYEIVKFTYISDGKKERFSNKLRRLLMELKEITTDSDKTYIDKLLDLSSTEKLSYIRLKLLISKLTQEIERYDCFY